MNQSLYYALLEAHDKAAVSNPNGSIVTARIVYQASGCMPSALAAACLAQGHLHAPIEACRDLLSKGHNAPEDARSMIEYGDKVPGFGNSFYPDGDPAFEEVENMIREQAPEWAAIIDSIMDDNPTLPPPNAAMWTAAVMEALKMPVGMGPALFIAMRVKAWAEDLLTLAEPEATE